MRPLVMLLILVLLVFALIIATAGLVAAACFLLGLALGTVRVHTGQP